MPISRVQNLTHEVVSLRREADHHESAAAGVDLLLAVPGGVIDEATALGLETRRRTPFSRRGRRAGHPGYPLRIQAPIALDAWDPLRET